jgi:hypothetical protein
MSFEVLLRRGPPSDHIAAQARREKNQAPRSGCGRGRTFGGTQGEGVIVLNEPIIGSEFVA